MNCPHCGFDNEGSAQYCGGCGHALDRLCPTCGVANRPDRAFCSQCGDNLILVEGRPYVQMGPQSVHGRDEPAVSEREIIRRYLPEGLSKKILATRGKIDGERKRVTVLFTDMVGYTPLSEALGEENVFHLMNRVYELMITSVHEYEGTVQKLTGDGVLALFGAPVAVEEAPVRACHAALEIRQRMERLRSEVEAEHGVQLRMRIGIHTGQVVVGAVGNDLHMEFEVVGDTVNLASRLETMAEPGTILMSEATFQLVDGYIDSVFDGEREVKGKSEPQRLYRLEGLKPGMNRFKVSRSRGLTQLVGRKRELDILEECYEKARQGKLTGVGLVGEAGIGKSRVVHEFQQRLKDAKVLFLQGNCASYGKSTSFLPFLEIVRTSFRIGAEDRQYEARGKLIRGLDALGLAPEGTLPFLLNLLGLEVEEDALRGLDGEIVGARTREVLRLLMREGSRRSPVIMFVDDLHWVDTATEELLRVTLGGDDMPLLFIGTYRPEYRPPWAGSENVTNVRLQPFSQADAVRLAQLRLGIDVIPDSLTRILVEKAEGNPLFAEEITSYLLESGTLMRTGDHVAFASIGDDLHIPGSLNNIFMARVDRLDETPRRLLQIAAVIGRRFPAELVREVSGMQGSFSSSLSDLEEQELIFREDHEGREEYRFKHALLQDAVYDSLLKPRREEFHRCVGDAIEKLYADRLGEWAELLAHHYSLTPEVEKAVRYLAFAGEKSLRVYALEEADLQFRQAVDLIESAPGCATDAFLVDTILSWARIYYYRKDFRGLDELLERCLSRVETLGDKRRLSLILFWLGFCHTIGARIEVARPYLERALELGEAVDDDECIGYACLGLMYLYDVNPGDHPRDIVERMGERALKIADRLNDIYLASKCLWMLTFRLTWSSGYHKAREMAARLLRLGREAGDPRAIGMAHVAYAFVDMFHERYHEAIESTETSLRMSPDPLDQLGAAAMRAFCLAQTGRAQEGLDILTHTRREFVEGDFLIMLRIDVLQGAVMVLNGTWSAGIKFIEAAIKRLTEWGDRGYVALGHVVLGEIYLQVMLRQEKPPFRLLLRNAGFLLSKAPFAGRKARYHLREALRNARATEMDVLIARALTGLGILGKVKKRLHEARAHLEEARQIAEPQNSPYFHEKILPALESLDSIPSTS